jgi:hypothetical protein
MKKSIFFVLILFIVSLITFSACNKTYTTDNFPDIEMAQNCNIEDRFFKINKTFSPIQETTGYYNKVGLTVNVFGYKQLTYYNPVITVTVMATAITDFASGK